MGEGWGGESYWLLVIGAEEGSFQCKREVGTYWSFGFRVDAPVSAGDSMPVAADAEN
jgi:hypothetical protein